MSKRIESEVLYHPPLDELRFLPEGPYSCGLGLFSWVAIQHGPEADHGSLNIFDLKSRSNRSYVLPGRPGFAFPTEDANRFVVGCERSLGIYDIRHGSFEPFVEGIDQAVQGTIINDGVTWDGNLIFGCKDLKFQDPKAGLYLYRGRDQKLIQLLDNQICSNGKSIIRHDHNTFTLIDIDTPTKQVVRYRLDLAVGRLSDRQVVLDLRELESFPDGMISTPDQKSIIISFYNPNPAAFGETRQYRLSDGSLEVTWTTPNSPQATCPQLVELDGKVFLVITTAVEHMSAERQVDSPEAGSIFIASTNFLSISDSPPFIEPK